MKKRMYNYYILFFVYAFFLYATGTEFVDLNGDL